MNEIDMINEIGQLYAIAFAGLAGPNGGEKRAYNWGDGILYEAASRKVSVDVSNVVANGDNRPVTSNAVKTELGNIEILLSLI